MWAATLLAHPQPLTPACAVPLTGASLCTSTSRLRRRLSHCRGFRKGTSPSTAILTLAPSLDDMRRSHASTGQAGATPRSVGLSRCVDPVARLTPSGDPRGTAQAIGAEANVSGCCPADPMVRLTSVLARTPCLVPGSPCPAPQLTPLPAAPGLLRAAVWRHQHDLPGHLPQGFRRPPHAHACRTHARPARLGGQPRLAWLVVERVAA